MCPVQALGESLAEKNLVAIIDLGTLLRVSACLMILPLPAGRDNAPALPPPSEKGHQQYIMIISLINSGGAAAPAPSFS